MPLAFQWLVSFTTLPIGYMNRRLATSDKWGNFYLCCGWVVVPSHKARGEERQEQMERMETAEERMEGWIRQGNGGTEREGA